MVKRISYVNLRDILALFRFVLVLPVALIAKIFIHHFWLICEDRYEARDNGYWLFRYIRENHPEQKVAYAIDKSSPDYSKVAKLGKIVPYGGWRHWFWYLVAEKNISSQKGGKPNAAACYLLEITLKILPTKRYFLQHGVIINDLKWLYHDVCRFRLFVCSAQPEWDYVSRNFGYPEGRVQLLGLARFDQLHELEVDRNLILVMPTWREWLARPVKANQNLDDLEHFENTEYCIRWNEFLNDPKLVQVLKHYGKRMIFYPHRNMQKYLSYFHSGADLIQIADRNDYDIQDLLKRAGLLITDYSSVFFDFAYMKKPVLFYQFDEEKFRDNQYQIGYFDYRDEFLGKCSFSLHELLLQIEEQCKRNFSVTEAENDLIETFFPLRDQNNCERNYRAILEDK